MASEETTRYIASLLIFSLLTMGGYPITTSSSYSNCQSYSFTFSTKREEDDDGVPGTGSVSVQQATFVVNTAPPTVTTTATTTTVPPNNPSTY